MCELRKEIMDVIKLCVRLEEEPTTSAPGDGRGAKVSLVLVDPQTDVKTVLGMPIVVAKA
jgi:hypothetical protein